MGKGPKKGLKRSGVAVIQYCDGLGWKPKKTFVAGVGLQCKEVDLFHHEWPDVPLVGFEPHPKVYEAIKDEFPGELLPIGLGELKGTTQLFNRPNHKNGSSFFRRYDQSDSESHEIEIDYLDNMMHLLEGVPNRQCLLWLDCEGSELNILRGGRKFIDQGVSMINVEMTGRSDHIGWHRPKIVHQELVTLGFTTVWVHSIRVPLSQYDAIYLRNDLLDETHRIW